MELTTQEMFNRSYVGLRSQNWEQCIGATGVCVYSDGNGRHCAWGWVDPELENCGILVGNLTIGVAKFLTPEQRLFATDLQNSHDNADSAANMERRMRDVANKYSLTVPN